MTNFRRLCAALAVITGTCVPAAAQPGAVGEAIQTVSSRIAATVKATQFLDVVVEGSPVSVRMRQGDGPETILIDAEPVILALKSSWDRRGPLLLVRRYQDGADMLLDVRDGKVRGNGVVLGTVPKWQPREAADTWLNPAVVGIMTGTNVTRDDNGRWVFTLDDRLRPRFDLDMRVNGEWVDVQGMEPRTVGPVLLIPLEPVVNALGSELTISPDGNEVTVTRIQDSAELTLDLATGLVTVNADPRGITPNMSFAVREDLLLPFSAVETLTGTNIALKPGGSTVEIELDERLAVGSMPGSSYSDEVASTGLTPERLEFAIDDSGPSDFRFYSRYRDLNTTLNYRTSGDIWNPEAAAPSFISLDIRSQDGWVGSVGDYNARFNEFQGLGVSRVRGVSFRKKLDDGSILAAAAGVQSNGTEYDRATRISRPLFDGFAAGVRRISRDGTEAIGLAAEVSGDGDTASAIATFEDRMELEVAETGLQDVSYDLAAGVFQSHGKTSLGVRGRVNGSYDVSEQLSYRASAGYESNAFANPQSRVPSLAGVFDETLTGRFQASASVSWRSVVDWGVFATPSAGGRVAVTNFNGVTTTAVGGSINSRFKPTNTIVSINASSGSSTAEGAELSGGLNINAIQRFEWGDVTATYSATNSGPAETRQRFVASVSGLSWVHRFENSVSVSVTPRASVFWTPERSTLRLGAGAAIDSGQAFGRRFSMRSQISTSQSVDPLDVRSSVFASANARYLITRNIALDAGYVDDFNGRRDFSIGLRGAVTFADPRPYLKPEDGLGILKGRVFFDRNRDGIRQSDEPGLPGIQLRVVGRRLALPSGSEGVFTIQNLKPGLYELTADLRSLPMGYLVPENARARATIADGMITEIDIPIIASGQVRGTVFADANGDGQVTPGEKRVEGMLIRLRMKDGDVDIEQPAAAFGQFGFENLDPGPYTLSVSIGR